MHTPDASTTALGGAAAKLAHATAPSTLSASASAWWAAFWARSFVHLPTEPAIEALWNGAQYILACSASPDVDPATPAPGLGGPFVTSDNSGWSVSDFRSDPRLTRLTTVGWGAGTATTRSTVRDSASCFE